MNPLKIAICAILLIWPSWALGADKPNILFIAIDDLNDWPSSFRGYRGKIDTPNIDLIANRGMRFDNAFSCAAQCSPSRNALFWGMRQTTTGYYENGADIGPSLAIKNNPSLTEYFTQQGYEVNGAGKLYPGGPKQRALFSHYFRPDVPQKMGRLELNKIGPPGGPEMTHVPPGDTLEMLPCGWVLVAPACVPQVLPLLPYSPYNQTLAAPGPPPLAL